MLVGKRPSLRYFLADDRAVSEEFTALPALSVVMIGFTLFFVLLANTYSAYHNRADQLERYHTADLIATTLITPSCDFITQGMIDYPGLSQGLYNGVLTNLRDEYRQSGLDFVLLLHWDDGELIIPEQPPSMHDRIAVSREVSIQLNPAQTTPGSLTVLLWEV